MRSQDGRREHPYDAMMASNTRVMTFNIRCDYQQDGENSWSGRRDLVVQAIRNANPDLLGTQEVLAHQGDYLDEQLPGYDCVRTHREDGLREGEACAIHFRRDRFELQANGTSWLSETPEVVNSFGWDAVCTRIVSWAALKDRSDGKTILFANAHFDHEGKKARIEAAKLVPRLLADWSAKTKADATMLVGDFNDVETSPAYAAMTSGDHGLKIADAFRAVRKHPAPDEPTFHGYSGTRDDRRIDWILTSKEWTPTHVANDHTERGGRFPSDHFAVIADLSR